MQRLAFVITLLAAFALPAQAQRTFPPQALRGEIVVGYPPAVALNGKPARLAPGARIRDESNILQLSASLSGRRLIVHYTLDPDGQLADVWILTPPELARRPWPTTPKEAQTWIFNPVTQSWSKP
jgi:hypothetical protein